MSTENIVEYKSRPHHYFEHVSPVKYVFNLDDLMNADPDPRHTNKITQEYVNFWKDAVERIVKEIKPLGSFSQLRIYSALKDLAPVPEGKKGYWDCVDYLAYLINNL